MAHVIERPKAKLIIGVMYSDLKVFDEAMVILTKRYGQFEDFIDYSFDFTDYYENEMGKSLKKRLYAFEKMIDREELTDLKIYSNSVEDNFSKDEKRRINLDPGYLTRHNVVLASAKELPHRVYIKDGMFGDVVLVYKNGKFIENEHTFPDYRSEKVKNFLKKIRDKWNNKE